MSEVQPTIGPRDLVERRMDLVPSPRSSQLINQFRTTYQSYMPDQTCFPGWTSYAAQHQIRSLDMDPRTGWLWLATWGGVLCWDPGLSRCIRHTSAHGLIGNSTRCVVVDQQGVVWAASQEEGLSSLSPDGRPPWQPHHDFRHWTVLSLIARPQRGVYAALRDTKGRYALGEIDTPDGHLHLLLWSGLACRNIEALLVDSHNTLWIGNALGLHRYQNNSMVESFDLGGLQVHALEADIYGNLWIGTNHGLIRFEADQELLYSQDAGWPLGEVLSLVSESGTGTIWVATLQEVGCIVKDKWQPVPNHSPGLLSGLLATLSDVGMRVWIGGLDGLYEIVQNRFIMALTPDTEDSLSNAVFSVWADEERVWMGTARGVYYFNDQVWHNYNDVPDLCSMQSMVLGGVNGRPWVGTWGGWLGQVEQDVYVPVQAVDGPITALTVGYDGTMWAATPDAVYYLPTGSEKWQPVTPPAGRFIGKGIIQALCYQLAEGISREKVSTLWVGTSSGLFRFRPELGLWDSAQFWAPGDLENHSIQVLILDPLTGHLWVGTREGLFSDHGWQCHRKIDVRALAFSPEPEGTLWLGTARGLEQWPSPDRGEVFIGEPTLYFTTTNSGLAADIVTALAVRNLSEGQEVWIGSPAGVNRYRYGYYHS